MGDKINTLISDRHKDLIVPDIVTILKKTNHMPSHRENINRIPKN
jgi:hypothetical protein